MVIYGYIISHFRISQRVDLPHFRRNYTSFVAYPHLENSILQRFSARSQFFIHTFCILYTVYMMCIIYIYIFTFIQLSYRHIHAIACGKPEVSHVYPMFLFQWVHHPSWLPRSKDAGEDIMLRMHETRLGMGVKHRELTQLTRQEPHTT